MLYIPCVEFQFCIHYVQLPFEKNGCPRFPRGGKTLTSLPPQMKPWLWYPISVMIQYALLSNVMSCSEASDGQNYMTTIHVTKKW